MDKLAEIIAHKRREIAPWVRPVTEAELARSGAAVPPPPSFARALRRADHRLAVVAEIKRRSPSAGEIKAEASAVAQARLYQEAGADALSVLTDAKFFGGTIDDLRAVAGAVRAPPSVTAATRAPPLPCLRKDFIVHAIQVLQAREAGASAILLIVRALSDDELKGLFAAAVAAGLEALFEIHDETELGRALRHGARIIGVNNRDLTVFTTDLGISERLIPLLPPAVTAVSESGIFTGADAARARAAGAHAILAGEALMKSADPARLIEDFRNH
ncbi:MAG TPA: indole-3-glycerol phosphate synthase TrpC [Opitutaceae bacterium]|nr:indole-3-glycerol phosphate synthase TrpC [Opitutaceae bacterium]